ncbi:hypothetical protein [Acinetobacter brisouii]|uniref:hypothetical protein n=1 Tax=Acinetobacter brisouii TaxID=396323 RepID=UPI00124C1881|nr:hypothetical protein [Acinetobacter brisouii]
MASDIKNVKLGVCKVTFGGTDLGYTKGGVDVTVATETHQVQIDQFGQTPINEYIMGRTVTVKVPMAETTLQNLVAVMPGAKLVGNGEVLRVDVPTSIGTNLLDFAKELVLHPISKADADKSEDFVVPLAATAGALDYGYKLENERIFNCEFKGYPATDGKLFAIGDPAAA